MTIVRVGGCGEMHDHDVGMLVYTRLAVISQSRGQLLPRDRFLLIAGAEALKAGFPPVAERCRALILEHNKAHLVGRFPSFAQALSDAGFQRLLDRTEQNCPLEKAEFLLARTEEVADSNADDPLSNAGESALKLLGRSESPGQPLH